MAALIRLKRSLLEADLYARSELDFSLCFSLSLSLELLSRWLGFVAVGLVCLIGLPSVPYFEVAVA
jgi:hypothetical protein